MKGGNLTHPSLNPQGQEAGLLVTLGEPPAAPRPAVQQDLLAQIALPNLASNA